MTKQSAPHVQTRGLLYVTLLVADVSRSRAFYRDVLGLEEVQASEHFALLASGTARVGLHSGSASGAGSVNLHFEVDDVDAAYEVLNAVPGLNLPQAPRVMPWGLKAFGFEDPDGYRVELVECEGGS